MEKEHLCQAKGQMVALMQAGVSWKEAASRAGVEVSRSTAYRLLRQVCVQGDAALRDSRHGHPAKLRAPVLQWLETTCRTTPQMSSRVVQAALQERFGILVSIGHLNRVRADLGVGSRAVHREKNCHSLARQRNLSGKKGQVDFSS